MGGLFTMKRILLFWLLLVWFTNDTTAQSIRKDYREMTGAEMNDYVAALNTMRSTSMGNNPANHHGAGNWIDFFGMSHGMHFNSPIHTRTLTGNNNGRWFLPWHRVFLTLTDCVGLLKSIHRPSNQHIFQPIIVINKPIKLFKS
jgi:hypothetical protein